MNDVDVMAFGAHPDDIEIGCGGTLLKLSSRGRRVVLVDLVRGELATRGTVDERNEESAKAAGILGAHARENLELKDGHIAVTDEAKRKVAEVVRTYRPRLVMVPYCRDRHPDHYRTSEVVYEGLFMAGLLRFDTGQESFEALLRTWYAWPVRDNVPVPIQPGDVNGDRQINLKDAILAVYIACGMPIGAQNVALDADVNDDGMIGLPEAFFVIQKLSLVR